ncbi:MAG: dTDP-4-dehydrorhamnose reductase [Bacteroidaceae bacterium]|nr:dTDP-4-dehydrorhamnose reductase [Bacteroidaceae bacterium]
MQTILVTGSNGQLGSELQHLVADFDEEGYRFIFTDVAELDITDRQAVSCFVEDNNVSILINCAAYTAVDKAEHDPEKAELLNRVAPGYLAEAMEAVGGTMIQISTDYVFDGMGHMPYREDAPTHPTGVYGRTKLAGEEEVICGCTGSMVIRTAWLYSTFGNNFVKTMLRLGREREHLSVVFDQIGTPTYARDLAKVILTIVRAGIKPGVFHYTNEGVCSWYDFARAVHRFAGLNSCDVRPVHTGEYPAEAPRPHYSVLDKTKIKEAYTIQIPWWEDSLKECVEALK